MGMSPIGAKKQKQNCWQWGPQQTTAPFPPYTVAEDEGCIVGKSSPNTGSSRIRTLICDSNTPRSVEKLKNVYSLHGFVKEQVARNSKFPFNRFQLMVLQSTRGIFTWLWTLELSLLFYTYGAVSFMCPGQTKWKHNIRRIWISN
jgi:hypothetical protein